MSLQSIQRRHPWIMAPTQWLSNLLTPERWPFLPDALASSITRLVAFDTTGIGRAVRQLSPFGPIRDTVVTQSSLLRSLDWRARKAFWTAVWCTLVASQGWPRRAPRLRKEPNIRLLSAPETYDDFQSPTLVVPEAVCYAEKSLINMVTVQMVHLLQDLYPLVRTHQAPCVADPQERFDRAYTAPYRLVREPPRWHPDLVAASERRNLLGALAAGGPFAKLLQRADAQSSEYVIDLQHLANYDVREGLCRLGSRITFSAPDGHLAVTGVEFEGDTITPDSPRWNFAERIALAGLMTHATVWRQGMEYHVGGLAPVAVLTHNHLPPAHPLRRMLAPHLNQTMTTNFHTHLTLRRSGFDVTGFTFPQQTILRYYDDGAAGFDINRLDVAEDAKRRGIPDSLDYPYLPQALRYYSLIGAYVRQYISHYYPGEAALQSDGDVRAWFEALDQRIVHGVRCYVADLTRDNLIKLCTLVIYSLSVGHTENSLSNYAMFMPTTVRRDGVLPSVGEVQNIVNFQFLITSPTTLLVSDLSHMALDEPAAEIMRGFRRSLLAWQDEMARQPSRHWQLFPNEVEASVSC